MDSIIDNKFIHEFFSKKKLTYYFDDNVSCGKRQPITSNFDYTDKVKILTYGSLIDEEDIKLLSIGLPDVLSLREFITQIHDQDADTTAVSCAISTAINIRTNYINYQRYRLTRWIVGNKFVPVKPSVLYIHWNADVKNVNRNRTEGFEESGIPVGPSIASHLISIESHKIVDSAKYPDYLENMGKEPDLLAFYHASKSQTFEWFKVKPSELSFKLLLSKGYPIICGIVVYPQMLSLMGYQFGMIKMPTVGETPVGAQPIVLIGCDSERRKYEFVISWGNTWGDEGCGTIDFDYILNPNLAGDFCYITYKGW